MLLGRGLRFKRWDLTSRISNAKPATKPSSPPTKLRTLPPARALLLPFSLRPWARVCPQPPTPSQLFLNIQPASAVSRTKNLMFLASVRTWGPRTGSFEIPSGFCGARESEPYSSRSEGNSDCISPNP